MKTKINKANKEKPKAEKLFSVRLDIGKKILRAKGLNLVECLDKINPTFTMKAKGILALKYDGLKLVKVLKPWQIKRLLASDLNKQVFQKQMLTLMK